MYRDEEKNWRKEKESWFQEHGEKYVKMQLSQNFEKCKPPYAKKNTVKYD